MEYVPSRDPGRQIPWEGTALSVFALTPLHLHTNERGGLLTKALRDFSAPSPIPFAGQDSRERELVSFQAGIAHARTPAKIRAHDFPIGEGLRGFADDS